MIDMTFLGEWGDNDRRHARARSPGVNQRRTHMVPTAPVFIIGYDDGAIGPELAPLDRAHQIRYVHLTGDQIGITGMLVVAADRLDKAHARQSAASQVVEEGAFILEMFGFARRAISVVGVVGKRLMMELKQRIGASG